MTYNQNKNFPVSWEELHRTSKALAWRLLELGPFKGIIAVTRVVSCLQRSLHVNLKFGSWKQPVWLHIMLKRGEVEVMKAPEMSGDGNGWLIIDDLVDTGETGKMLRQLLPKAHFATVYAKPLGRPVVDTFITEVSQDTWIFFPWDLEPQPSRPLVNNRH